MPGIREALDGIDVLVTGGSGFMGKVLLERLMRSTNVRKIYMIIRHKRGLGPQARINEMIKLPVFDLVRKACPERLKILVPLEGELGLDNIGLTVAQIKELEENVGIIFNFAASLKLEDPLKTLVTVNTQATLKLLEMACKFKKLKSFVHLSTAFCHCELDVLEEKLYDPPANPRDIIDTMSWMDNETANKITPALLGPHPNCYTYTKRLAEALTKEFVRKIPIVIVRPSIVTPALQEPCKGWVDSLNGPMGVLVAGAKGVLRSMLCSKDNRAEVIPVDVAINAVVIAAWKRYITENTQEEVTVCNLSVGEIEPVTWGHVLELGKSTLKEYPLDCGLWYPGGTIRTNPYTHALIVFLCQVIPAYVIDFIFFLARQKRFMVRVQERIRLGSKLLQYFTMKQWTFKIKRFLAVLDELSEEEKEIFYTINAKYTIEDYMKDCILGARLYLMKEPLSELPKARRQLIMMWWIEKIVQAVLLSFLGWLLYSYIPLIQVFFDSVIASAQLRTKQITVK